MEKKSKVIDIGGLEELDLITSYMSRDQWDYERVGLSDGPLTRVSVDLFEGRLTLNSNGTWSYKE